jgi:DASH family cryptochrome
MVRRIIVWFRNDLRLHDCAPLHEAARIARSSGPGAVEVLPVYCFDPRQYGTTDDVFEGKGWGAPKTAHFRAKFILESVLDLKRRLQGVGSDLLVLTGRPEQLLPTMLGTAAESTSPLVLASAEAAPEEQGVERALARALRSSGATLELRWGHSLYDHADVLAQFGGAGLERMPDGFTPFKNAVERNCPVPPPLPAPAKGELPLPSAPPAGLDFSPTLSQLPWTEATAREGKTHTPQPEQGPSAFTWGGGESAALARVEHYFFGSDAVARYFSTRNGMLGTEYSTKFAPWLAVGALSPRWVQARLSAYESERTENKSTYWVRFELTWRDFFWFFTLKHGSAIFQPQGILRPNHPMAAPSRWQEGAAADAALERWKQVCALTDTITTSHLPGHRVSAFPWLNLAGWHGMTRATAPSVSSRCLRTWPACAHAALVSGHDRYAARRRQHARARGDGLDVQPWPAERRLVPDPRPRHRLAPRRRALRGDAAGLRHGLQLGELGCGGGPDRGAPQPLQHHEAVPRLRPRRRVRACVAARAGAGGDAVVSCGPLRPFWRPFWLRFVTY